MDTNDTKPENKNIIPIKAIGVNAVIGLSLGAAFAYVSKKKYWQAMLIGGFSFASLTAVSVLKK